MLDYRVQSSSSQFMLMFKSEKMRATFCTVKNGEQEAAREKSLKR